MTARPPALPTAVAIACESVAMTTSPMPACAAAWAAMGDAGVQRVSDLATR